jgi:hypothetical protein
MTPSIKTHGTMHLQSEAKEYVSMYKKKGQTEKPQLFASAVWEVKAKNSQGPASYMCLASVTKLLSETPIVLALPA